MAGLGQSYCLQEAFPSGLYSHFELPLIALIIYGGHKALSTLRVAVKSACLQAWAPAHSRHLMNIWAVLGARLLEWFLHEG